MTRHRVFSMSFASVYPLYLAKAERKGRSKADLDQIIHWLTGYDDAGIETAISTGVDMETFVTDAPALNPARDLITGSVCGVKVQEVEDPIMRELRYLDKLVDELARGRAMEKILRSA